MKNRIKQGLVFLGLSDDESTDTAYETEILSATKPAKSSKAETNTKESTPLAPLRKLVPASQPAKTVAGIDEIFTVHPTSYADARLIAETFRDNVPVIMDLSKMKDADAKRVIDFCSGLVMGLNGNIERVTGKVFVLRPFNVLATSDEDYQEDTTTEEESVYATGV